MVVSQLDFSNILLSKKNICRIIKNTNIRNYLKAIYLFAWSVVGSGIESGRHSE